MKLVWLVNFILPQIADFLGKKKGVIGGWTVRLADILAENPNIDFTVFYPQSEQRDNITGRAGNISYVGFYENAIPELYYNADMTERMKSALDTIKPDIVHIWGSEYVHTLSMVRAFNRPERTVISITGLIYKLGSCYNAELPEKIVKRHTFRDFIRQDSIEQQKEKFLKRGECEKAALREVKHVIGRTGWDKSTTLELNPDLVYHKAGEILRKEFYDALGHSDIWKAENTDKHRIFMTQSYYPIKGIHFVLKALSRVKETYPDVLLAITGKDMRPNTIKELLKQDSYGKYVCDLISEYGLNNNIEFLGEQFADDMVKQYLRSSAFLLPSVMENSSNSLGEAMMLGVPCIAARTGGTPDMINEDEGWLYEFGDTEELAEIITSVLKEVDRVITGAGSASLSDRLEKAGKHAMNNHDIKSNSEAYIRIYDMLLKENNAGQQ